MISRRRVTPGETKLFWLSAGLLIVAFVLSQNHATRVVSDIVGALGFAGMAVIVYRTLFVHDPDEPE